MTQQDIQNTELNVFVNIKTYGHVDLHVGNLVYEMSNKLSPEQMDYIIKELALAKLNKLYFLNNNLKMEH